MGSLKGTCPEDLLPGLSFCYPDVSLPIDLDHLSLEITFGLRLSWWLKDERLHEINIAIQEGTKIALCAQIRHSSQCSTSVRIYADALESLTPHLEAFPD